MSTHGPDIDASMALTLFRGIIPVDFRTRIIEDIRLRTASPVQRIDRARPQTQWMHREALASNLADTPYIASITKDKRKKRTERASEHVQAFAPAPRDGRRPPPPPSPRGERPPRTRPAGPRLGPPGIWPRNAKGQPMNPWIAKVTGCNRCGKTGHDRKSCGA